MNKFFECKARYEKIQENGTQKKVTEPYLVAAVTPTEVEARIVEALEGIYSEIDVTNISERNIADIWNTEGADFIYRIKCAFVTLDENTGKEKLSVNVMVTGASDFEEAYRNFKEHMRDTVSDWRLISIEETKIIEVLTQDKIDIEQCN